MRRLPVRRLPVFPSFRNGLRDGDAHLHGVRCLRARGEEKPGGALGEVEEAEPAEIIAVGDGRGTGKAEVGQGNDGERG